MSVRYSSTEVGIATASLADDPPELLATTVGQGDARGRAADRRRGQPAAAAPARSGEVVVRSPATMRGYWRDPEATAAVARRRRLGPHRRPRLPRRRRLPAPPRPAERDVHPRRLQRLPGGDRGPPRAPSEGGARRRGRRARAASSARWAGRSSCRATPAEPPTLAELRAFVGAELASFKRPGRAHAARRDLPVTPMFKVDKRALRRPPGDLHHRQRIPDALPRHPDLQPAARGPDKRRRRRLAFLRARFGDRAELIVVDDGSAPEQRARRRPTCRPARRSSAYPAEPGQGRRRPERRRARARRVHRLHRLGPALLPRAHRHHARVAPGRRRHRDRRPPASGVGVRASTSRRTRRLSSVVYTWLVNRVLGLRLPRHAVRLQGLSRRGRQGALRPPRGHELRVRGRAPAARARRRATRVRRQPLRLVHNEDSSVSLSRHAPRCSSTRCASPGGARRGRYD